MCGVQRMHELVWEGGGRSCVHRNFYQPSIANANIMMPSTVIKRVISTLVWSVVLLTRLRAWEQL